jgi:hypothetical protein
MAIISLEGPVIAAIDGTFETPEEPWARLGDPATRQLSPSLYRPPPRGWVSARR